PQTPTLEFVRERFGRARSAKQAARLEQKLRRLLPGATPQDREEFARLDRELARELGELDDLLGAVVTANEPSILASSAVSQRLAEAAGAAFPGEDGAACPLLPDAAYFRLLSIPRGTLDDEERDQIRSHVVQSFRFLSAIRWTRELRRIPEIARAHHEKLDGSGYPYHMKAEEIPLAARMMTIADIFDALTAADRPYKQAVAVERALDIIGAEVAGGQLDPGLFRLFVDAKVYQLTAEVRSL
ncbi:MAG TPA: HD domain-containing phosphohydrolase, partial [Terriglobia bacterium]|nr:HD domain-containing phosphohydrolase [Terriglobia bacterium]